MACAEGAQEGQMAVNPADVTHLRDEFQRSLSTICRRMRISHQEAPYTDNPH
ncbi:Uncharacterised protein [Chlamydia trachomatis]|nr:Uncharacterised protein [Chlamydia trachomatis]